MGIVLKVLAVVVAVVLVLVGAVSWFLAGLVLDGAQIKGDDARYETEVLAIEGGNEGTIVYRMVAEAEDSTDGEPAEAESAEAESAEADGTAEEPAEAESAADTDAANPAAQDGAADGTAQGTTADATAEEDAAELATDANTVSRIGLRFRDGGYLQLDQDAVVENGTVTRSYTLLAGQPPEPGDIGKWDWPSYPSATTQGLKERAVTYAAPLGPTPAIVVEPKASAPKSSTWAVVVHGRNGSVREGLRIVPRFAERGMTTMLINYRDDRKEPEVPQEDGIGDFGMSEWADLEAAVGWATANGAEDIVLVGYSMGGAIVAGYLERAANTESVVGTVLISPAMNFHDITLFGAERMGIPTAPLAPIIWGAERFVELRSQLDYEGTDYIDNAATWPVPALVTAATEDDLVPPASIEAFAAELPEGTYQLFQDAFHTGEWNKDWITFDTLVAGWLDEYAFEAGRP